MGHQPVTGDPEVVRREVPQPLYAALPASLSPVLRRVYAARRVGPGEVTGGLADLLPVGTLAGTAAAAAFLADRRSRDCSIVVVGDYDTDGATASALAITALRAMGFGRVTYLVPNRFQFGYGLSPAVVDLAAERRPDVLITVDNGITSIEGVARARALDIDVVITDHHLPGTELPEASAIVNPNLGIESFASKSLCGVGVVFYLMAALARELDRRGLANYATVRTVLTGCLDFVALGTVADLVPLDRNNRILVAEGLRRIRAGRARPGIEALFSVAGRDCHAARSADLGFAIAPRLNAAGRLTDMSLGIDCLLAGDRLRALALARRLDDLNAERQVLQARMQEQAEAHLGPAAEGADASVPSHCLFDPEWHEGIVGLVASRVRERTGRPVVAFARAEEAGLLKGSARSIDGVHIRDVFATMTARGAIRGMTFGGHAMAAGVKLPEAELDGFRWAFAAEIRRLMGERGSTRVLWTDGPLELEDLGLARAEEIHFAGPWGQGFPEPLFDNTFAVLEQRVLKDAHLRLSLQHTAGGDPVEAIAFNETRQMPREARLLYRLGINDFGGRRRQQLVVEHVQGE